MMKTVLIAAAFALAASSAVAATPVGPFHMDPAAHRCKDSTGKFVMTSFCSASAHSYKLDAKGKCHDEKGHFAKANLCPMVAGGHVGEHL
jgi:hypothetical protein